MYPKTIFRFIVLLTIASCKDGDGSFSMNTPSRPIAELKIRALNFGDTIAYEQLSIAYLDEAPGKFYPIASKMADKYAYPNAYFDAYLALLDSNQIFNPESSLELLDQKIRSTALLYLFKGAQKGHSQSKDYIAIYFAKGTQNGKFMDSMIIHEKVIDSLNILNR